MQRRKGFKFAVHHETIGDKKKLDISQYFHLFVDLFSSKIVNSFAEYDVI